MCGVRRQLATEPWSHGATEPWRLPYKDGNLKGHTLSEKIVVVSGGGAGKEGRGEGGGESLFPHPGPGKVGKTKLN